MVNLTASQEKVNLIKEKAKLSRLETIRLISLAKSGHYGSSFSCSEIFATLYYHVLRYNPNNPKWENRDRFVMGKGHSAVGVYPLLADVGFFPKEELDTYTEVGSAFGDHPDMNKIRGIDFSSGSIGHGLSVGVGMALAARLDSLDYRTYILMGDGELQEGQVWEAAMSAPNFKLGNLVAIVDNNKVTVDGVTAENMSIEPIRDKWESFGWNVIDVDGHDIEALIRTFENLPSPDTDVPTVIIADTVAGKGVSFMENGYEWHVANLGEDDKIRAINEIKEMN
jgi:transketolase